MLVCAGFCVYTLASCGKSSNGGGGKPGTTTPTFDRVVFAAANSFIVNPPASNSGNMRVYMFPVDQVNTFWSNVDNSLTINFGDSWTVDLIWQDTPTQDFIRFVDVNTGKLSTTMSGNGPTQKIAITTKTGYSGNALIGLKKKGKESEGYLWSWHLWVTDYDPTYTSAPIKGQYTYSVTNGDIQRYAGQIWESGMYKNSFIMDRNLGARTNKFSTVGVLYYQYGRKDPFPMIGNGNNLYDVNGTSLNYNGNNVNVGTLISWATAVKNPDKFYCANNELQGNWSSDSKYADNCLWDSYILGLNQKSLFDPCPPGWKLPVEDAWFDFTNETCGYHSDPALDWNYRGEKGLRYWPYKITIAGNIYYPAVGERNYKTGEVKLLNDRALWWSASPYDLFWGVFFSGYSNGMAVNSSGAPRSYALPVRCVKE
jgi:uncharacterized protein (TIGR02145 family)